VDLYNLLAIVLPDDVVKWQVVPRLLGQVSIAPTSAPPPKMLHQEGACGTGCELSALLVNCTCTLPCPALPT
jgi:hypothetical protein